MWVSLVSRSVSLLRTPAAALTTSVVFSAVVPVSATATGASFAPVMLNSVATLAVAGVPAVSITCTVKLSLTWLAAVSAWVAAASSSSA